MCKLLVVVGSNLIGVLIMPIWSISLYATIIFTWGMVILLSMGKSSILDVQHLHEHSYSNKCGMIRCIGTTQGSDEIWLGRVVSWPGGDGWGWVRMGGLARNAFTPTAFMVGPGPHVVGDLSTWTSCYALWCLWELITMSVYIDFIYISNISDLISLLVY